MKSEKENSNNHYLVFIIIILALGFMLYRSYEKNELTDEKVLDYVRENISFSEVCDCYKSYDIKEYVYNRYTPSEIWDDIIVLQDHSWWELIDYNYKDMYGQTLMEYMVEAARREVQGN